MFDILRHKAQQRLLEAAFGKLVRHWCKPERDHGNKPGEANFDSSVRWFLPWDFTSGFLRLTV